MAETQHELHNRIAGEIVRSIVRPPIEAGGGFTDVLVLLESVVTGVIVACAKEGGDEIVLNKLVEGVKGRLPDVRLGIRPAEGSA